MYSVDEDETLVNSDYADYLSVLDNNISANELIFRGFEGPGCKIRIED
jgi:hypothetical protein